MKNYTITVNGNVYAVTGDEPGSTPSVAAPKRAASATPAPAAKPAAAAGAGSILSLIHI